MSSEGQSEFLLRGGDGLSLYYGTPPGNDPTGFSLMTNAPYAHLCKGSNFTASCLSADGRLEDPDN